MSRIDRRELNLEATLTSGQSFCWRKIAPGEWSGWIAGQPCWISTGSDGYSVSSANVSSAQIDDYFQLSLPLSQVLASFPVDPWLTESLQFAPGLRILRQDPWETLASFICSSVKQIVQIQAINQTLRERFGPEILTGHHGFPDYPLLAQAGETALRECKLGFRARHLHRTAVQLEREGAELSTWHQLPTAELKARLMDLPGVGEKIADCVLLFAFGRYEVFPIDVWVERVLVRLYFARARNKKTERLRTFALKYFGPYRGYAQQYLFHWIRTRPS